MAFDPIIKDPSLSDIFTAIADAIRVKTEKTGSITPSNFPSEIATISAEAIKVYSTLEEMRSASAELGDVALVYDFDTKKFKGLFKYETDGYNEIPQL